MYLMPAFEWMSDSGRRNKAKARRVSAVGKQTVRDGFGLTGEAAETCGQSQQEAELHLVLEAR